MSIVGRFFWTLCLWIPPLICFEDFCSGNPVEPMKAWQDFNSAFLSRFPSGPIKEDTDEGK